MTINYVRENFTRAVRSLAVGSGPIHERLVHACVDISVVWSSEAIPEGLRADVDEIKAKTSTVQDGELGSIRASIEKLSVDEAVELAELILALDYQLESM